MKSLHSYIIKPKGKRYNNTVDINGIDFIVNTKIFNHKYISREAEVLSTPLHGNTPIQIGDTVIVHHNIFRRWHDVKGRERNSSWFIDEDKYLCSDNQIFMYKRNGDWIGFEGFCFVSPVENDVQFDINKEKKHTGILEVSNKYLDSLGLKTGDLIGFTPSSEYEFEIEGKKMYKMSVDDICLLYETK